MTDYAELVDSLSGFAKQLRRMVEQAAFVQDGHVRVRDPDYLIGRLEAGAQAITALVKDRDEDYAIGLKLRQELAADNARLREALASIALGYGEGEAPPYTAAHIAIAALARAAPTSAAPSPAKLKPEAV